MFFSSEVISFAILFKQVGFMVSVTHVTNVSDFVSDNSRNSEDETCRIPGRSLAGLVRAVVFAL